MPTLDSIKAQSVFCMLKGEPGTRKSTQALGFPTPQYWIPFDGKMDSLIYPGKEWGVDFKQVEWEKMEYWANVEKKLKELELNCKYKTIVIDSVTSMGDFINLQTLRAAKGATNKEGKEKDFTIGGISVNTLDQYKAEASAFTVLMDGLKKIREYNNVNVVVIAHVVGERLKKEGDVTNAARIIITGGKGISGKIPVYCSEVYHFDVEKSADVDAAPGYLCYTAHSGMDYARTALNLPHKIVFNNDSLYQKWIAPAMTKLNNLKPVEKV